MSQERTAVCICILAISEECEGIGEEASQLETNNSVLYVMQGWWFGY